MDPQTYKLTNYQKKKKDEVDFTYSPFYTHTGGYHMAFNVIVDGVGSDQGTHVSVYALIVQGEYDQELKWPLPGSVTVTLLNQLEDCNHHTEKIHFEKSDNAKVGSTWGLSDFIPHSELGHDPIRNTQYLKDDTLYFKVSVNVESA